MGKQKVAKEIEVPIPAKKTLLFEVNNLAVIETKDKGVKIYPKVNQKKEQLTDMVPTSVGDILTNTHLTESNGTLKIHIDQNEELKPLFDILYSSSHAKTLVNQDTIVYTALSNTDANKRLKTNEHDLNQQEPRLNIDVTEFINLPFYATDNITGKQIFVNPSEHQTNDKGYFVIFDANCQDYYVIEPPKFVILNPVTNKELVIDPRKPVGQYYSTRDSNGNTILLDTSENQPYIMEDPSSGARILIDDDKVKPYWVKDPKNGSDIRIDPLYINSKPYVYHDKDENVYSVTPVIPGSTPVLYKDTKTGEPNILGGPVMIRDVNTGDMVYQEGVFTMRNPETGQTIKQVGTMIVTDTETKETILMSTPQYVKDSETGRMVLEPTLIYKHQQDGQLIPTMPEKDAFKLQKIKNDTMIWDNQFGTFINPVMKAKLEILQKQDEELQEKSFSENRNDDKHGKNSIIENKSLDSILENKYLRTDRKRIRKYIGTLKEEHEREVKKLMKYKEQRNRLFIKKMLKEKEEKQNIFSNSIIKHIGNDWRNCDQIMYRKQIEENIKNENQILLNKIKNEQNYENNKMFDIILVHLSKRKKDILKECNVKGIDSIEPNDNSCEHEENAIYHTYALEVYNQFKLKVMKVFEEELKSVNEKILKDLHIRLNKEMKYVRKKMDKLYSGERYLIVRV